ncbi:DUF3459 domain-containing protein [Methylobacterium nodulans]|uniref:DUF3459 domain-containing protein n=1 Tax=Methylobacterium nodulans TaxID=114616 RepID=UPI000161874D|nr:DUF3459 domain-containing protein [Methylobacterium nodulans]
MREIADRLDEESPNDASSLHDRGRLIGLRRDRSELQAGRYRRLLSEGGVLAFARWQGRSGLVVVLNLSASDVTPALTCRGRIILGTDLGRKGERIEDQVSLSPHEGVIAAAEGG